MPKQQGTFTMIQCPDKNVSYIFGSTTGLVPRYCPLCGKDSQKENVACTPTVTMTIPASFPEMPLRGATP